MVRLWQRFWIARARSARLKRTIEGNTRLVRLATRFVGGTNAAQAIEAALALRARGITASLFYLGEYVTDRDIIEQTVRRKLAAVEALAARGLDVHVSVDPTQIGYSVDDALGLGHALRIGRAIAAAPRTPHSFLMLDMEDSSLTSRTIRLRERLAGEAIPTAITLQAYLKRTPADLAQLIRAGAPSIRLVKGAFAEPASIAWTARADIDRAYLELARTMLGSRGLYPVFATHDERMIDAVTSMARQCGAGDYEFEMLYGVRPNLQRRLVDAGRQLRLYLPFGEDWWPYTARRVGENPRNALILVRALSGE